MNTSPVVVVMAARSMRLFTLLSAILVVAPCVTFAGEPVEATSFNHARVTEAWKKYADVLTFGHGQTLALVDDGCKLSMPEWSTPVDGRPKVLVSYDSIDGDDDPKQIGRASCRERV